MTLTPRDKEIKLATADLVDAMGGLERSAAIIGKGKSHVHRCTSVNEGESFLNLRDAAELERRSPLKLVTREMCKLAGGVFVPLPECFGDDDGLAMLVVRGAREFGDVAERVSTALADGKCTPSEGKAIEIELDELIEWAVTARRHVQALNEKPAAAPLREVSRG